MPRKPITKEMKQEVVKEAQEILFEINKKLFGEVKNVPKIFTKLGGYTGAYYKSKHEIGIHYYVWKKASLGFKRLLMIHENNHALGLHHSGVKKFSNTFDLLSIRMYLRIYGEDPEWNKIIDMVETEINKILNS